MVGSSSSGAAGAAETTAVVESAAASVAGTTAVVESAAASVAGTTAVVESGAGNAVGTTAVVESGVARAAGTTAVVESEAEEAAAVFRRSTVVGSGSVVVEGTVPITVVWAIERGIPWGAAAPRARPIGPIRGRTGGSYFAQRRALNAVQINGTARIAARP